MPKSKPKKRRSRQNQVYVFSSKVTVVADVTMAISGTDKRLARKDYENCLQTIGLRGWNLNRGCDFHVVGNACDVTAKAIREDK